MKYIKYTKILLLVSIVLMAVGCDRDLPYPVDQVKKGVVVDITRIPGTVGVISEGDPSGDFKVKLLIPPQQGDYSFLDYAQLVCVYTPVPPPPAEPGEEEPTPDPEYSVVVIDKIEIVDGVAEVSIDMASVYTKLGLTKPVLGETLSFTVNTVLKDGTTIPGWSTLSGYHNKGFSGWLVDDRPYSVKVSYGVSCPFVLEDYIGTMTMADNVGFAEDPEYPVTVEKVKEENGIITLLIKQFFDDEFEVTIQIDTESNEVTMPKKVLLPKYGNYNNLFVAGTGLVETCQDQIVIRGGLGVDEGYFVSPPDAVWILKK